LSQFVEEIRNLISAYWSNIIDISNGNLSMAKERGDLVLENAFPWSGVS
jgi:hypothetical protein